MKLCVMHLELLCNNLRILCVDRVIGMFTLCIDWLSLKGAVGEKNKQDGNEWLKIRHFSAHWRVVKRQYHGRGRLGTQEIRRSRASLKRSILSKGVRRDIWGGV